MFVLGNRDRREATKNGPMSGQIDDLHPVRHDANGILASRRLAAFLRTDRMHAQLVRIQAGREKETAPRIDSEAARRRFCSPTPDRRKKAVRRVDAEPDTRAG